MPDGISYDACLPDDGRLALRPWRDEDAVDLHAAAQESVGNVGRWLPWCRDDYGPDQALAWVAHCRAGWLAGSQYAFAVRDAASGELLGGCGINEINPKHRSGNLGYWIRTSRQRQGMAIAAARRVARFGFIDLGLIRIEIVTMPGNHASRRLASKLGAQFEAIARQRLWAWDRANDAALYALITSDLDQPAAAQNAATSS